MKTLVLGLGNPILRDDSVGLRVAELLRPLLADESNIDIDEDYWGGLRLMERMVDYDKVIIIDAICTSSEPGTIHRLSPGDVPTQHSASAHDVNLPTALEIGRRAGARLPKSEDIILIGVEAADVQTFDETLSPEVEASLPLAVEAVLGVLKNSSYSS